MMQVLKITNNTIIFPYPVEDGFYYVDIKSTINKTVRDWQKVYFIYIDLIRDVSGYSRYELHDMFKASVNVKTTKNFDTNDWCSFIEQLQFFALNNFDVVI